LEWPEGHEVRYAEEASSEDVAEEAGDGVRVEDIERVVQLLLEEHHGDPAQTPISMADHVCRAGQCNF
jgi:hypothetical protein